MYGIFRECYVSLKLYMGNGALLVMFLAAAIYILATEKSIKKKVVLGIMPLVMVVGFLCPIIKKAYVKVFSDGTDTYYRLLWLVPIYLVIGFGACKAIFSLKKSMHQRVALVVTLAVIAITGTFVYTGQYMSKAENLYHIPQSVVDVVDVIAPKEGEPRVRAAFPDEMVHFVRQYNTNILMPYGREMVVTQWDYYNSVYEVMVKPEVIDAEALVAATRETKCSYIILNEERAIDGDLTEQGLELVDTVDGYLIYADPEVIGQK
ncbi:hypothetical protein [Butyrivibrio proteoclasticus]|uniref:hypothetical protein n=1 Tax=Butyrivibrio proteoclasticus TaxID=43305 RepID=UPI00047DDABA|nr:hypothetical protein [Butyrivibrio proteoclasticus]